MQPFKLKWAQVDWASVYSVGQRVAKTFFAHGCVFLAGDSCHTHSSGAGQGMNAGVNDAANLGWKLALVLMGRAKPGLLETYNAERQVLAEKLIRYDEGISELVSGRIPRGKQWEKWQGEEDPNVVLGRVLMEAKGFNTGLTLGYGRNPAVWKKDSDMTSAEVLIPAPATPGNRAPDVRVLLPALWEKAWLLKLMPNRAQFHILTFVGRSKEAKGLLRLFKDDIEGRILLQSPATAGLSNGHSNGTAVHVNGDVRPKRSLSVQFLTILPEAVDNGWHELGFDPLGRVYYDDEGAAFQRYDVSTDSGTAFVVRPDGWIGARIDLNDIRAGAEIARYLEGLLV